MRVAFLFFIASFFVHPVVGQYQIGIIPRVSPDKKVTQKIGFTTVEISYGSPSVNNRPVWGKLVPYNKVWRAGANNATTIELTSPLKINGNVLDSGQYSFSLLPKKNDKWTAIFNKVSKQWGTFNYDEKEDALRVEVTPKESGFKTEKLSYTINQTGYKYGSFSLFWDFMEVEIPFETNYLTAFEQKIEERASGQPGHIKWISYMRGAEHLEQIGSKIKLALKWIDQAETMMNSTSEWNKQYYPRPYVQGHLYWIKAKILAWDNNFSGAVESVDLLKNLKKSGFYDTNNKSEGIGKLYDQWKKK